MISNNKITNNKINKYILKECKKYALYRDNIKIKTLSDAKAYILDNFNEEVGKWYTQRVGEYNALKYWISGLCGIFEIFLNEKDLRNLLKNWFNQTKAETLKYDYETMQNKFKHLIIRELRTNRKLIK